RWPTAGTVHVSRKRTRTVRLLKLHKVCLKCYLPRIRVVIFSSSGMANTVVKITTSTISRLGMDGHTVTGPLQPHLFRHRHRLVGNGQNMLTISQVTTGFWFTTWA